MKHARGVGLKKIADNCPPWIYLVVSPQVTGLWHERAIVGNYREI